MLLVKIVGTMWNRDEGDILEETLLAARGHVDELLVVDNGSMDNSWDIIRKHKDKLAYHRRIESGNIRQHILKKAVKMFGHDIWIQVCESDMMILDTDIRTAIEKSRYENFVVWTMVNATRKDWTSWDQWPNWSRPITEVMDYGYVFEQTMYTFRPLPGVNFTNAWRPYPVNGWPSDSGIPPRLFRNLERKVSRAKDNAPLLAHFNYRGPAHFKKKARGSYRDQEARWLGHHAMFQNEEEELFHLSRKGWIEGRPNAYRWKWRKRGYTV